MLKKHNNSIRNLTYIHLNENKQYTLTYGIEFAEFTQSLSSLMNHLLLLKHQFDDSELNVHTMFEYVPVEKINKLTQDQVSDYGDFCWIDFEGEEGLNELSGQELAELLYLGHRKDHLEAPFYQKLRNRYVYLAHDDGWWNKVYYRNMLDFYRMLGDVLAKKITDKGPEKNIFGMKKKRVFPMIPMEVLLKLKTMMKEGILISIKDAEQNRSCIEIPIWIVGDFDHMDDMIDEYERVVKNKCDAKLVFDKKLREWKL